MNTIPDSPKLCECGCGQILPPSTRSDPKHGYAKGQPRRFISGHSAKTSIYTRFDSYVDKRPHPQGCWLWVGMLSSVGYGRCTINGKTIGAHRISYELHNGPIPKGLFVLHKCDIRACVNPAHLFLGTNLDNMRDRDMKGRGASGARHWAHLRPEEFAVKCRPGAKLTEEQVTEIRQLGQQGVSQAEIARQYGVSRQAICRIQHNKVWRYIK